MDLFYDSEEWKNNLLNLSIFRAFYLSSMQSLNIWQLVWAWSLKSDKRMLLHNSDNSLVHMIQKSPRLYAQTVSEQNMALIESKMDSIALILKKMEHSR